MMFHGINTGNSQFSTVTKHSIISRREYLEWHLKLLHVQVHVITTKQEKLCERLRVVLTCNFHVQVRVPVGPLNLSIIYIRGNSLYFTQNHWHRNYMRCFLFFLKRFQILFNVMCRCRVTCITSLIPEFTTTHFVNDLRQVLYHDRYCPSYESSWTFTTSKFFSTQKCTIFL